MDAMNMSPLIFLDAGVVYLDEENTSATRNMAGAKVISNLCMQAQSTSGGWSMLWQSRRRCGVRLPT